LTLTLQGSEDENKLLVKLKNRMPRRQKVNLSFSVKFHKNQPAEEVELSEAPVDPADENNEGRKDTVTKTIDLKRGVPRDGIYGVEQVLTVNTAAVRRIDQICIGSNTPGEMAFSHRTIVEGLRALKADPEKKEDTPKTGENDPLKMLGRPGGQLGGFMPDAKGGQKDNGLNK